MDYKKIFIITIFIVLALYLLINLLLFIFQKDLLYFPNKIDFSKCENFKNKKVYKNTRFYEVKWENNNLVIFFHWNVWRACDRKSILNILKITKNNIIFVEYAGYAEKWKQPDIKKILQNVEDIWDYVKNKKFDKIYVIWRSLWTGPASYFAWKFKTDKLILISPYSQLYKVAQSKYPYIPVKYLFTENFVSEKYLKNYKNDILIIHWKKDKVIPYKFWLELYNWLNNVNKKLISKNNWNHHNVYLFDDVKKEIVKYFSK